VRKSLTDKGVAALKPRAARYAHADPELRGHYVRVQPTGAKSFVAVTLDPHGKQVWATIGRTDVLSVADAKKPSAASGMAFQPSRCRRRSRRRSRP
jgi:Arm DNA-binding domain